MRARHRFTAACLAFSVLPLVAARADDDEQDDAPSFHGHVSLGWRFLQDEHDGRFQQDHGLLDGPRLFGFEVEGRELGGDAPFDTLTASADGVGDRVSRYALVLRRDREFELDAGFRREDSVYQATGDPYDVHVTRDTTHVTGRFTPSRIWSVTLGWNRTTRRGTAFVQSFSDLRSTLDPLPPGADQNIVFQRRPLNQSYDDFDFAATANPGIWRFGLTQSVRLGVIDDERAYAVPAARRTGAPVSETFSRDLRSKDFTTVLRGGFTLPDDSLEGDVFATLSHAPIDTRISGERRGVDGNFPQSEPYSSVLAGDNRIRRTRTSYRAELLWRPVDDVEVVASGETERVHDDASLELTERRTYVNTAIPADTRQEAVGGARISETEDRWAVEVDWDVHEDVRLRAGHEFYRQHYTNPVESSGFQNLRTVHRSRAERELLGVDWDATDDLDVSVLARIARDDRPHSHASAEESDAWVVRSRYKADERLSFTGVFRTSGYEQRDDFSSHTRASSASLGATWSDEGWTVELNGSVQHRDTRTDTSYYAIVGGSSFGRPFSDTVSFRARDTIVSWFVQREVAPDVRVALDGSWIDTGGSYRSRYHDLGVRGEWDVEKDVTLSATLRSMRLDESGRSVDDYSTEMLEIALTYRF